jgi:hypothetical protein
MAVRQFQLVEAGPSFTPLRFGLLSAAAPVTDSDPHWQQGTVVLLDPCGIPLSVTGGPCSASGITKSPTVTGLGASAAEPFSVYAWINCAPVGHGDNLEDLKARTEQLLTNGEGRAIESVFWTGDTANGPIGGVHPHLAEDAALFSESMGAQTVELQSAASVLTTGAPVSVVEGLALLEGALGACYGGEGVIHVPAAAVAHLSNMSVLTRQGSQLRTELGNVVAAYSSGNREGPTSVAPAAGQAWMYATGAVFIRRSGIKNLGMRPAEFVGRADNSTVYVVERTYVIDWTCCHFAVQVNIPMVGAV